ncbi:MAG: peptidoglycan-associated lipoprotein Pal [Thiomicrorhabdus sp.]|nr:peptidoglycan-associated lipoprotein Pal [Thiomicrorhabdus sp.]
MLKRNIKQLLVVGFVGFTLVGCSSTPEPTEGAVDRNQIINDLPEQVDQDISEVKQSKIKTLAEQKAELLAIVKREVVYFDFDQSDLASQFYSTIKANADYMALEPTATVTIKGYCDERGTREYNIALGERRANSVQRALIAEGVSPSRIEVVSYGEENPAVDGHNEAAWSKNRRATFSY